LRQAVTDAADIVAVLVSVTTDDCRRGLGPLLRELRPAMPPFALLLVGGAAVSGDEHARRLGADGWAADAAAALTLVLNAPA
jgi:methanogenic corrinoid protein MtbC1